MLISTVGFIALAALIFFSGKKLSVYGEKLADILGWGKGWVGLILMASVTSLPELMVGIGSVTIVGSADLALGNILGSCAFNLGILSMLDAFVRKQSLLSSVSASHSLSGAMTLILIALVGLGIFLEQDIVFIEWIGFTTILFIVIYFVSIRIVYRYEHKVPSASETSSRDRSGLKHTIGLYVFHAAVVVIAALFLPEFAETIAVETGLSESFIGTLFLAASTSLPEIAVSFAAVRLGSLDMATGNLLGSNLFNILILAINDMFYAHGHILKDASDNHLVSVFFVIMMTSIAIVGLTYRVNHKRFLLAWDTFLILIAYIINIILLYSLG